MNLESVIINSLVNDSKIALTVSQIIKPTDFEDIINQQIITSIIETVKNHKSASKIEISTTILRMFGTHVNTAFENMTSQPFTVSENIISLVEEFVISKRFEQDILLKAVDALENPNSAKSHEALKRLVREAKEITDITLQQPEGHDYKTDFKSRFNYYKNIEDVVLKSRMKILDRAKFIKRKSLSLFLGISNSGKTLHLTNIGASALKDQYNVAYITFEDGELEISQRIDQNLLDVSFQEITNPTSIPILEKKFENMITNQKLGNLKVFEFTSGSAATIQQALEKAHTVDGFKPDIILVDYLGLMSADGGIRANANSYEKYKSIAEELRSLAFVFDCAVISAVQANRGAFKFENPDELDMGSVSESIAIAQTADTIIGLFDAPNQEESEVMKQTMILLKSRKVNKAKIKPINVIINTDKQQVYDIERTDPDKYHAIPQEIEHDVNMMNTFIDEVDSGVIQEGHVTDSVEDNFFFDDDDIPDVLPTSEQPITNIKL